MKQKLIRGIQIGLIAFTLAIMVAGCASSVSTKAHPLKPELQGSVDLSKYQTVTVLPFQSVRDKNVVDANIGMNFSNGVARRLQNDFGTLFTEVRKAPALGRQDELIVTGTISEYKPGSKLVRGMIGVGMGAAHFKGDVVLKDGADNHILFSAPFSKLWAWGGVMGASKGIEEMVSESEASVATTIAQGKGWSPPPKPSKTK